MSDKKLRDFPKLQGIVGVAEYVASPTKTYGDGIIQRAQGRAPSAHHVLNQLSATIREHTPLGFVWWTDISNQREPDYNGNTYARVLYTD